MMGKASVSSIADDQTVTKSKTSMAGLSGDTAGVCEVEYLVAVKELNSMNDREIARAVAMLSNTRAR